MSTTFKKGDRVQWNTSQGVTHGVVQKKVTAPMEIKQHHVDASAAHPQYLVKSEQTGAEAAHKADALIKVKRK